MGLTRPNFSQINTRTVAEADPIQVLNSGSTQANVDVGFLINRDGGTTSNVALFWNESSKSFVTAFTTSSGITNANITATSYANITAGSLFADQFFYSNGIPFSGGNVVINGNINYSASSFGNSIPLGTNALGTLTSNAATLTTATEVTDAIAQLNSVLGKLVPASPPNFPGSTTVAVTTTNSGLMSNFTQTDNSGWGNLSVAGGTLVNTVRTAAFTTSGTPIVNVGPGTNGTVTAYVNGSANGMVTLTGNNTNTTSGNLYVYNVQDYHAVVSSVSSGFWSVFSTYAQATGGINPGWNRVAITDSATATSTNTATWYYDNSNPAAPSFSSTSIVLSSNVVAYSSTIPHLTSSAGFTIRGSVVNLSGDTYPNSTNLFSSTSSGGVVTAPTNVTYTSAGISLPMARNSAAVAQFTTTANVVAGFGRDTSYAGPAVTVTNGYNSASQTFTQGNIILYKTGTGTQIEETALTNSLSGSPNTYRIVNPDGGTAADTPTYTGSESAFNSQTSTLLVSDATVVGAQLRHDVTNYSSGYLPVGPNLSGHSSNQYFTFKFARTAVSKFNIAYTGTIAGLWVALPGVTDTSYAAPTNGWLNVAQPYFGSGVPGTGTGANGSAGCAIGGAAVVNSAVSNGSYTCTFGTQSSTNSTNNEIYVRVKLTAGQTLTALSIQAATN